MALLAINYLDQVFHVTWWLQFILSFKKIQICHLIMPYLLKNAMHKSTREIPSSSYCKRFETFATDWWLYIPVFYVIGVLTLKYRLNDKLQTYLSNKSNEVVVCLFIHYSEHMFRLSNCLRSQIALESSHVEVRSMSKVIPMLSRHSRKLIYGQPNMFQLCYCCKFTLTKIWALK